MKKNWLNLIDVPTPCDKSWNEMIGDDKSRLCLHCDKNIHNLDEMTAKEIEKLIFQSKGRVCVRLTRDEKRQINTKNNRRTKIAASVLSATLSLSIIADAQSQTNNPSQQNSPKNSKVLKNTSRISFTILDSTGEVISDAKVKLVNDKTRQSFVDSTDEKGVAYFQNLPKGRYYVEATMEHFKKGRMSVVLKEVSEPNIEMTLEIGQLVGVVVIGWYETPIFNSIIQEDFDVVRKYISERKNVNIVDKVTRKTMLHLATEAGNFELVKMLIDAGAKVNAKDKYGRTPIILVGENYSDNLDEDEDEGGENEFIKIVNLLISKGADVNVRDKDENSETLLMKACDDDNLELVKILLEAGANPNLKDDDGETAMMKTDSEEIKKLLKKYGAKS